jgi:hypothetical protein
VLELVASLAWSCAVIGRVHACSIGSVKFSQLRGLLSHIVNV